jgi:Tfp pilus assembly protein FimT
MIIYYIVNRKEEANLKQKAFTLVVMAILAILVMLMFGFS